MKSTISAMSAISTNFRNENQNVYQFPYLMGGAFCGNDDGKISRKLAEVLNGWSQ